MFAVSFVFLGILTGVIMLFEVYKDNKRIMYTTDKDCVPPADVIKSLKSAGYKILLDGKTYKAKIIK